MEQIIRLSSERGDLLWEPFGGLFTLTLAAARLGRRCVAAEVRKAVYQIGAQRLGEQFQGLRRIGMEENP
jgi:site-specific DNA-methyltransferase (adenine-specific)